MFRLILVLTCISAFGPARAWGFWADEKMGLDWELLNGGYPGFDATHSCASFSSVHHRVPEIDELREAYRHGITDPKVNPEFAELILERKVYFSNSVLIEGEQKSRLLFDFGSGSTLSEPDKTNVFRGLLCVVEPGKRRFWFDKEQGIYWQRQGGKATLYVARNTCLSPLGNSWLPSIEQLEKAFANGLSSEAKNPIYGYALNRYQRIVSSTPEVEGLEDFYWALDFRTGRRIAVPVGFENLHYFVCAYVLD